ncbi:MAG: transglycosylase SLT domain-containing protein [Microcoleus sp.]
MTTGEADALWYRFRYNGGTYWVPSAWTGGYPGSRPPLLPPAQAPAQQYQQPPVSQQPTNNTVYLSTNAGEILQVDESTGASHKIYQGRAFTDLAVAPNGKLYGCTFYDGLYEINPSTGAERYVGPLAGGSLNSLTFSADGRLYGADQRDGNLFQISPDNGQMNLIGNLGGPSSGDLVFNGANEIFATVSSPNTSLNDRLVAVNLATGNSRYIGDLGLLEVYGLSWENGQLTAYTSDRRKLAIDPNTAKATVVGTVSSNGLIWGAATKPATASSPTDDVRQKFLYAASQYPQVGAAITGMQDQGGGVFRQEFERAIMIWNGQQVTVYETKGRSASPTSPSPKPQPVNNINQSLIAALRAAIFGQESGYNYKAVNPNSGALGIAQVMPANIPSWSREALGYQITDNQFLNSPDLQLKIIDYKLNQYYQQAIAASGGNLDIAVRRVASAWYSGNPSLYNSTTPEYTNGVQYPSIANYTLSVLAKFQQAYGGGSSGNTGNPGGSNLGNSATPLLQTVSQQFYITLNPLQNQILTSNEKRVRSLKSQIEAAGKEFNISKSLLGSIVLDELNRRSLEDDFQDGLAQLFPQLAYDQNYSLGISQIKPNTAVEVFEKVLNLSPTTNYLIKSLLDDSQSVRIAAGRIKQIVDTWKVKYPKASDLTNGSDGSKLVGTLYSLGLGIPKENPSFNERGEKIAMQMSRVERILTYSDENQINLI